MGSPGQEVYIVSGLRTPIGSFSGSLSTIKASDLGSIVIRESLKRANLRPSDVSEVIIGQVLPAGQGQNPARQAAIAAGLPVTVPAYSINMLSGSGLKSIANGYLSIKCGESEVVVAGGQENMSLSPHAIHFRHGLKIGNASMLDTMLVDGLTDAFENIHMGVAAENIAQEQNISQIEQDRFAFRSQQKTNIALSHGYFDDEIVRVVVPSTGAIVEKDECPRPDTTMESLDKLKPTFVQVGGTVTAGNSSAISDGAAAVVLMSKEAAEKHGIKPMARIVAYAETGVEPRVMGMACIPAIRLVLKKARWSKDEVDLYELNEAYAAQALTCIRTLGLNPGKVNVNGGMLALGHPLGASGTRIVVTLLHQLRRTGARTGVASLCIGGGMGNAIAIERI